MNESNGNTDKPFDWENDEQFGPQNNEHDDDDYLNPDEYAAKYGERKHDDESDPIAGDVEPRGGGPTERHELIIEDEDDWGADDEYEEISDGDGQDDDESPDRDMWFEAGAGTTDHDRRVAAIEQDELEKSNGFPDYDEDEDFTTDEQLGIESSQDRWNRERDDEEDERHRVQDFKRQDEENPGGLKIS